MDVRISQLFSGVMLVLVLVALAAPAAAQSDEADSGDETFFTMDVEVGLQGYAHPDELLPVVIDLTSEELLVGRVDVTSGGSTIRTDVEIPANGQKQYVVYGPAPGDRRQVNVSLVRIVDGADEQLERQTVRLVLPSSELLVGQLGVDGITTALRSASSTPLATDVTPLQVSAASLSRGGGPLAYLVLGGGSAADLDTETVDALTLWVRGGGRIIGTPAALERFESLGTGDVLDRAPAAITRLGQGELIAVADVASLQVAEWSVVLRDIPPLGLIRTDTGFANTSGSLVAAATAGREATVPALPWLLGSIALFIVLVGPVNFLLLRRAGKPEWAWVTVPALSLVFVAGFWLIGRSSLQDFTVTTASIVVDDGLRTDAATGLVVQIERGGTHDVELPESWQPGPRASGVGVEAGTSRVEDDGTVVYEFELEDLGVGAAEATYEADPIGVELAITAQGREIQISATNQTGSNFWAWGAVVDGIATASSDPLASGETGDVSLRNFGVSSYSYEPVISSAVQRRLFYVDDFDSADFSVVAGLAGRAQSDMPALGREGIFFFGFTDDIVTTVAVDGVRGDATGTTLLLKRGELGADALAGLGKAQPELLSVAGASGVEDYGDGRIWAYGAEEVVFGYVVPAGVNGSLTVDPGGTQLSDLAVYDWSTGAFVEIAWGDDLSRYTSAGGEVVLRTRPEGAGFFDEGIVLNRYAIEWGSGT